MSPGLRKALALLVPLTLLAAACGSGGTSSGGGAAGGGDLKGTTIEVIGKWSGDEQKSFEAVLAAFADKSGATVRYTSAGDEIAAVLGTRVSGGNAPDVGVLPQPGLLRDLAAAKHLQPIEDVAGTLVDDHYSKDWRELATVDGTLYGVWVKGANKSTVWYRKAAFDDAGVKTPTDWATFLKDAGTIADSGVSPVAIGGADGWTLTDWFENIYLRTAGPEKYDQLASHQLPWTDPSVKTALTTLGQLFGNQRLLAGGTTGSLQTDFPGSVVKAFGSPAQAAIVYEGDFVSGVIGDETKAVVGKTADYFAFPDVNGSPKSVVGGGDVAVLMKASAGGKALIKYLASPAAAEVWAKRGGYISPNQDVDTSTYPDDTTRRLAKDLTEAKVFRFDMSDLQPAAFGATSGQGMWGILQGFLQNPADVDGAAQRLEDAAARAYAK
jgi:alpha-glucoside transport system substrate-binding protein